MFDRVSNVIKSAAGLVALLPGIGIMLANIETPPRIGHIYGGMVSILGFLIVIGTQALYSRIKRLSWVATFLIIFVLLSAGFASLVWYKITFDDLVRTYTYEINANQHVKKTLVLPLEVKGELKKLLDRREVDGDWAMALSLDTALVERQLEAQNNTAHAKLFGIFLLLFSFLIVAMTIAAWRAAADLETRENGKADTA